MKVKSDHRSKFSNLSNWKEEAWVRCSGFESRWSPDIFRRLLSNCLNWKIYCDDRSSLSSTEITASSAKKKKGSQHRSDASSCKILMQWLLQSSAQAQSCTCARSLLPETSVCLFSGLDVLGEISLSSTRQSGFAKAARECLLDSNLPAKYAMTGSLSCNNIIQDGFYDCGPVRNRAACINYHFNAKRPKLEYSLRTITTDAIKVSQS